MPNPSTQPNPARAAVAVDVSVSDQALSPNSRGIYIGGAGTLEVLMADDSVAVQFEVASGTLLPIQCKKVLNANTTATLIVALL